MAKPTRRPAKRKTPARRPGQRGRTGAASNRIGAAAVGIVLFALVSVGLLGGTIKVPGAGADTSVLNLPTISTGHSTTAATVAQLAALQVKDRANTAGYTRDAFGPAWADVDHNGCDTRNDILSRDLTNVVKDGSCTVVSGVLHDPYTGHDITFTRGQTTSTAVQIDHRVALGDAWQTGAQGWDAATREKFANDPANLLAVDGPTNTAKNDFDASQWLPPNKAFRCQYVTGQVQVKATYHLWVTQAEHDAMAAVLATC